MPDSKCGSSLSRSSASVLLSSSKHCAYSRIGAAISSKLAWKSETGEGSADPLRRDTAGAASARRGTLQAWSRRQSKLLLADIGVLVIALGVMTALWITTNNQLSALQESASAAQAAESEVPDVKAAADRHFAGVASVHGDPDSVSITVTSYNVAKAGPALRDMLDELGFSSAVVDRMNNTRALDGTLEATGHNCNVTGPTTPTTVCRWCSRPSIRTDAGQHCRTCVRQSGHDRIDDGAPPLAGGWHVCRRWSDRTVVPLCKA